MIKINLLRDPFIQSASKGGSKSGQAAQVDATPDVASTSQQTLPVLGIVFCMLFCGLLGGGYYYWLDLKFTEAEERNVSLTEEKDKYKKYFELEQQFREQKESLKKQEEVLTKLKKQQQLPVHFLEELGNSLPENIWLVNVTSKGPKVEIKGESLTEDAIYTFRENLVQRSQWFRNVTQGAASRKDKRLEFTLTFDLIYPA